MKYLHSISLLCFLSLCSSLLSTPIEHDLESATPLLSEAEKELNDVVTKIIQKIPNVQTEENNTSIINYYNQLEPDKAQGLKNFFDDLLAHLTLEEAKIKTYGSIVKYFRFSAATSIFVGFGALICAPFSGVLEVMQVICVDVDCPDNLEKVFTSPSACYEKGTDASCARYYIDQLRPSLDISPDQVVYEEYCTPHLPSNLRGDPIPYELVPYTHNKDCELEVGIIPFTPTIVGLAGSALVGTGSCIGGFAAAKRLSNQVKKLPFLDIPQQIKDLYNELISSNSCPTILNILKQAMKRADTPESCFNTGIDDKLLDEINRLKNISSFQIIKDLTWKSQVKG